LREAATCLAAGASKLQAAVEDGVITTASANGGLSATTVVVATIGTYHIVKQS
jgi:hypothetical protein